MFACRCCGVCAYGSFASVSPFPSISSDLRVAKRKERDKGKSRVSREFGFGGETGLRTRGRGRGRLRTIVVGVGVVPRGEVGVMQEEERRGKCGEAERRRGKREE